MANTIYRIERFGSFKERLIIKGFKSSDAMHKFLNDGDNALRWAPADPSQRYILTNGASNAFKDLKPGRYAYAGGKWHNVKTLDSTVLAHI